MNYSLPEVLFQPVEDVLLQAIADWLIVVPPDWDKIGWNPNLGVATVVDVAYAGIEGAAVSVGIDTFYQAIKIAGAYCRNEQTLAQAELEKVLDILVRSGQSGWLRGTVTKTIQEVTGSSWLAALGFTVCVDVMPVVFQALSNQLTVKQAIAQVGPKAFTSGLITIMVLMFPDLGKLMLGSAIAQAIWQQLPSDWQNAVTHTVQAEINGLQSQLADLLQLFDPQPA